MARLSWLIGILLAAVCMPAWADASQLLQIGGLAVGLFTPYGWIAMGLTVLLGAAEARRKAAAAADAQRAAYNASLQDRNITTLRNDSPWQIIYGSPAPIGGSLVALFTSGNKDQFKHLVIAFAAHECVAIDEVYIEGDPVGTLDGSGWATSGSKFYEGSNVTVTEAVTVGVGLAVTLSHVPLSVASAIAIVGDLTPDYGPGITLSGTATIVVPGTIVGWTLYVTYTYATGTSRVNVQKHLSPAGADTADAFLIAAVPSQWTTAHKLSGYTYIVLTLDLNMARFQGGPPNVTAKIRGKKIYDYRTSTTIYSTNPALCTADFLRADYGFAAASGQIDSAAAIVAANACDAQGYNCHGAVSTDASRDSNLLALEDSMSGRTHWSGGVWRIMAGAWASPVMTITDADLAAPIEVSQTANPRSARYNSVRGSYAPSTQLGVVTDYTPYVVSSYVTADGSNQWLNTSYPFTATNAEVQKLAAIAVERSRAGLTITYPAHLRLWKLQPGDRVTLTNAELGFAAKTFRVQDWAHVNNAPLALVLTEDVASMYTGTFTNVDPLAPTSTLADPWGRPAAPVGLAAASGTAQLQKLKDGTISVRVQCTWTPSAVRAVLQGGYTQVQWRLATATDDQWVNTDLAPDAASIYLTGVKDSTFILIRVHFITGVGAQGEWATILHYVVGKTAPPSDVGAISYSQEATGIILTWPAVMDTDLGLYEIRVGGIDWSSATFLVQVASVGYLWKLQTASSQVVRIKAIDTSGNYSSNASSTTVVITGPAAPGLTYQLTGPDEYLTWTVPTSGFLVDHYEIRYGASWAAGAFVDTTKATGYRRRVDYSGARTYWVAAVDVAGNVGAAASVSVSITVPGVVTSVRADVIDNDALLYWGAPATGSLPVDRYEVRKGASWAAGTVIGSNGNSTFAVVFEQTAGTYTYWLAAVDSAGTAGTPASVSAYINQPPDYILRTNIDSTFGGTKVSAYLDNGTLLVPVNTTETWTQHFVNNGFASPQAQITAGFPLYLEPSTTTSSYTEDIDYGSVLPATNITVTLNSTLIAGTVTPSCQIKYKLNIGDAWTLATAGATSALAVNFRYVEVVYTFTATAGANQMRVNGLNIKLSIKQRSDSGSGTAAVGGTAVTFGYPFIAADTPIVQPNGSTPLIPVVIYVGGVNPTGFTVKLYNLAGADVGGTFSWSVKGY